MPQSPSESAFGATSSSLFDLDLPIVKEGEGPLPPDEPSYELMRAHALFLLRSGKSEADRPRPNPEPFVLD